MLRRVSRRRELSVFICLTLSGKLYQRRFEQAIKGAEIVVGLRHLRQQVRGPLIIGWDRLTAHRGKLVQQYLASEPEHQPGVAAGVCAGVESRGADGWEYQAASAQRDA